MIFDKMIFDKTLGVISAILGIAFLCLAIWTTIEYVKAKVIEKKRAKVLLTGQGVLLPFRGSIGCESYKRDTLDSLFFAILLLGAAAGLLFG